MERHAHRRRVTPRGGAPLWFWAFRVASASLGAMGRDPIAIPRLSIGVLVKALPRLWGRDVMLYTGGVSFFIMLAIFPAVAIAMGLYSLFANPEVAAAQAEYLARLAPSPAD